MAALIDTLDTHIRWFSRRTLCVSTGMLQEAMLCDNLQIIGGLLFLAFGVHALYEGTFSSS